MSLYDPTTGSLSDAAFGLDTTAALAGEPSLLDNVVGVVTKGLPLTGLAIANSFMNTAIDLANWNLGSAIWGDTFTRWSISAELSSIGASSLQDYYTEHQQGIEGAAFVIGAFAPGMAGIKALKAVQAGKLGEVMQRATGIFSGIKEAAVADAVQQIQAGDAALFGQLGVLKFKAIAAGYGDQALQALAFETAVAGTMKASPILQDQDLGDIATNIFYGTLLGGAVGGTLEAFFLKSAIRRAEVTADRGTKSAELTRQFGFAEGASFNGVSLSGDRAALLIQSLDELPTGVEAAGVLGGKKIADTVTRGELRVRTLLGDLAGKGNEDLSTALSELVFSMRKAGQSGDDIFEKLGGLAKISRIGEKPSIPTGDTFYVNRFTKGDIVEFSQLMTATPEPGARASLRYQMKDFTITPVIAKSTDTFTTTSGAVIPKYKSAAEAWLDDVDVFISSRGEAHINPKSPNLQRVERPGEGRVLTPREEIARNAELPGSPAGAILLQEGATPVTGAPLVINTITKAISSEAVPIVGDFGEVRLFGKGLLYGDKVSVQNLADSISVDTPTIDANARYLWAARRGIRAGDTIAVDDITMLESMYKSSQTSGMSFSDYMNNLRAKKVTLSDGSDLPYSTTELLEKITGAKDDLISSLVEKFPKMSAEEIAIRANVPESYIASGFRAQTPEKLMVNPEQWSQVNHIQLEYDIGNTRVQNGQILRGLVDSYYRIGVIRDAANAATAKEFGENFKDFQVTGLSSKDATIEGVGAKFLTFSNATYGSIGQQVERIGRFVTDIILKRKAAYSEALAPHVTTLRGDPQASAELGAFINVRRKTGEKYVFLPEEIATRYWRSGDTVVLRDSLVKDRNGVVVDWNASFTPPGFLPGAAKVDPSVQQFSTVANHTFYDLSPKVAAFERAQMEINNNLLVSRNNWYAAQGISRNSDLGTLYAPPIDTRKYPYFALVKAKEGTAFSDDSVAMITADSAEKLRQKIASLRDEYAVYDKSNIAEYKKALGDYEYDRNFMDNRVNSALTRRGVLNDVYPDTNIETIVAQYLEHNNRQVVRNVRDYVELGNAQIFAEIRAMGAKFSGTESSQTGYVSRFFSRTAEDPYDSYVKTALAVSPRENYKLWNDAQEKLESFASTAFNKAEQAIKSVRAGMLSVDEANATMERFGLGNAYAAATNMENAYYNIANQLPPKQILSKIVAAGNLFQSATAIRLDAWQSLINIISAPILTGAESNSVLRNLASKELRTELPDGSGRQILTVSKAIFGAVKDLWNPDIRREMMPFLERSNITKSSTNEYFQAIDNLAIPKSGSSTEKVLENINSALEIGAKLSGSQWSENLGRTISALTARRIFADAGYAGAQLEDSILTFVNRTHGNYVASQRPVAFQGPVGQALGLFQSYTMNFYQQMFRYLEGGEAKTLGIMAAMQTSLFGLQSLPGFQFINQHLVGEAAGNPAHTDLYSTTTNFFDKKLGDWLLYGSLSNILGTGLYSRGDINPRSISVLPVNPLDFPAVRGAISFVGNLFATADKIVQGGGLTESLMQGLEHNGLSRPLAGLGQLMQGYVSTASGSLISAIRPSMGSDQSSGWNDIISGTNFSRLAGARPLDEAIAMDIQYRSTLYQAKDTTRMTRLGSAVKEMLAGETPFDTTQLSSFMRSYVNAGGEIAHFGAKIMEWSQEANVAKANTIFRHLSSPSSRQQMIQMGGIPLPDFQNRGNTSPVAIPPPLPSTSTAVPTTPTITPTIR